MSNSPAVDRPFNTVQSSRHQILLTQGQVPDLQTRLYPGIAPGWVYYFGPTIAAFAITGTNPYY